MASTSAGLPRPWRSTSAAMRPWPAPTCSGRRSTSPENRPPASTPAADSSPRRGNGTLSGSIFPRLPPQPTSSVPDLERGIGANIKFLGRTAFDYLVELESEAEVRSLAPDMSALARLGIRGVIVTARSDNGSYDFVSRFFAPGAGIDEDPVTGSAHCGLGPFWGARLSKTELVGYQASPRGGTVRVRLEGGRAHLGGHAVTVLRGELLH